MKKRTNSMSAAVPRVSESGWLGHFSVDLFDGLSSKLDRVVHAVVGSDNGTSPAGRTNRSRSLRAATDRLQFYRKQFHKDVTSFDAAASSLQRTGIDSSPPDVVAVDYDVIGDDNHVTDESTARRAPRRKSRVSFDLIGFQPVSGFEATKPGSLDEWRRHTENYCIDETDWTSATESGDQTSNNGVVSEPSLPRQDSPAGGRPAGLTSNNDVTELYSDANKPRPNVPSSLQQSTRRKSESACQWSRDRLAPASTARDRRRMSEACVSTESPPCPPSSPDWILSYFNDDRRPAMPPGSALNGSTTDVRRMAEEEMSQLTAWCDNWYGGERSELTAESCVDGDDANRRRIASPIYNPNFEDDQDEEEEEDNDDDDDLPPPIDYCNTQRVDSDDHTTGCCNGNCRPLSDDVINNEQLVKSVAQCDDRVREDPMKSAAFETSGIGYDVTSDERIARQTNDCLSNHITNISAETCRNSSVEVKHVMQTNGSSSSSSAVHYIIPSVSITEPDGEDSTVVASSPPLSNDDVITGAMEYVSRENNDDDDDNSGSTEGCDGEWDVWNDPEDSLDEESDLDPPLTASSSRRFSERSLHEMTSSSPVASSHSSTYSYSGVTYS